jgi:hypothetical protein
VALVVRASVPGVEEAKGRFTEATLEVVEAHQESTPFGRLRARGEPCSDEEDER